MITCLLYFAQSPPLAHRLSFREVGLGLIRASSGDLVMDAVPLPALVAASAASVCSAPAVLFWPQTQAPQEPESLSAQCRGGGRRAGGGAQRPLPTVSLALVVMFRQNFVVFFPFYGRF